MTIIRHDISFEELLQDAKNNLKMLDECPGPHEFVLHEQSTARKHYKCDKCGGIVDGVVRHWYNQGLMHGKLRKSNEE